MRQDIRFCAARDGVRIAYALCRAAAPLVASGTWLSHLEQRWRDLPWRPWLEWLTGRHTVLRYDTRGCGLSDRSVPEVRFEQWVGDFESVAEAAGPRFVSALLKDSAREREVLYHARRGARLQRARPALAAPGRPDAAHPPRGHEPHQACPFRGGVGQRKE